MTSTSVTRRKDTGRPGNGGKYDHTAGGRSGASLDTASEIDQDGEDLLDARPVCEICKEPTEEKDRNGTIMCLDCQDLDDEDDEDEAPLKVRVPTDLGWYLQTYHSGVLSPATVAKAMAQATGETPSDALALATYEHIVADNTRRAAREDEKAAMSPEQRKIADLLDAYDDAEAIYRDATDEAEEKGFAPPASAYQNHDDALANIAHEAVSLLREQQDAPSTSTSASAGGAVTLRPMNGAEMHEAMNAATQAVDLYWDHARGADILDMLDEDADDRGWDLNQAAYAELDDWDEGDGPYLVANIYDAAGNRLASEVTASGAHFRYEEVPDALRPDLATLPESIGADMKSFKRERMILDLNKVRAFDYDAAEIAARQAAANALLGI